MVQQILRKELDETGLSIVARLRDIRDEIKGLRALEEQAKKELKTWLGIANQGCVDGEPVVRLDEVWRESFDMGKAKGDPVYAQMVAACTKVSSYLSVRLV